MNEEQREHFKELSAVAGKLESWIQDPINMEAFV